MQPHRDQRPGLRVEQPVRRRDAQQPVAAVAPRPADRGDLRVLAERVGDLPVPGLDDLADRRRVQRHPAELGHAGHQLLERVRHHEVLAVVQERLHRAGRSGAQPAEQQPHVATGEVGVLLGARQRELLLDHPGGEHEPGVVVPGRAQVAQGAEGVEARVARRGQPAPGGVEPQRRRAGQDADAVARPDRVPVAHALGVVPHPVAADDRGAGLLGDREHPAVDVCRHAGHHVARRACRAAPATRPAPGPGPRRSRRWSPRPPGRGPRTPRRRRGCWAGRARRRWVRAPLRAPR